MTSRLEFVASWRLKGRVRWGEWVRSWRIESQLREVIAALQRRKTHERYEVREVFEVFLILMGVLIRLATI